MGQAVSCIIFDKTKKKVLLIKRRDIPVWVLPGGGIDPGETPLQAAGREAFEETGLSVQVDRKVALYHPKNRLTQVTHFFECSPKEGVIQTGAETRDIAYFSLDRLPKRLVPFYKTWIADAMKNEQEMIEKSIEKTSYWKFLQYLISHPLLVIQFLLTKMGIHINR